MAHAKEQKELDPIQYQIHRRNTLRRGCRVVIVATIGVSVWANILHAKTNPVSVIISGLAPLLLALAFELISRIPLSERAGWMKKMSRPVATVVIGGIAAFLSYFHQHDAFLRYSDNLTAALLPVAIDGLMIVASISLIELNDQILGFEVGKVSKQVGAARAEQRAETAPRKSRSSSKRDKIIQAIKKSPTLSDAEISMVTGAHRNYVNMIRRELEKELASAA